MMVFGKKEREDICPPGQEKRTDEEIEQKPKPKISRSKWVR